MSCIETPSPLKTRAKGCFPFTLACPSFIFRAGYAENVERLAPFVDEIQLLFFESRYEGSLPSSELIHQIARLGQTGNLTFNVHLPSDIFPGHSDAETRNEASNILKAFIERCRPLSPSTFTLHLEREPDDTDDQRWQMHTMETIKRVLHCGIDSRSLSIENLNYDFALAEPIIESLDLSVCMDMGHLLAHGKPLKPFFRRWRERISVFHLHGVDGARDHLPLDRLSEAHLNEVVDLLNGFDDLLCLEIYSEEALERSLFYLKKRFKG